MEFALQDSLDWTVSKRPLLTVGVDGQFIPIDNKKALVRDDNDRSLGIVSQHYEPLQNEDLKGVIQPLVDEQALIVTNQGTLGGGKKVFIQAQLPEEYRVIGEDYKAFVTLLNSFDGTSSVAIGPTFTRVICNNTYAMAYKDLNVRFRHSEGVSDRVLETTVVKEFVGDALRVYAQQMEQLATAQCSAKAFDDFVSKTYQKPVADMRRSIVDSLNNLFYNGAGNSGKTFHDAFQAVTDYGSNQSSKEAAQRVAYSQFGAGNRINQRALSVALEMAAV